MQEDVEGGLSMSCEACLSNSQEEDVRSFVYGSVEFDACGWHSVVCGCSEVLYSIELDAVGRHSVVHSGADLHGSIEFDAVGWHSIADDMRGRRHEFDPIGGRSVVCGSSEVSEGIGFDTVELPASVSRAPRNVGARLAWVARGSLG